MFKRAKKILSKFLPIIFTAVILLNPLNLTSAASQPDSQNTTQNSSASSEVKSLTDQLDKESSDYKDANVLLKGMKLDSLKKVSQKRKDALKKLILENPSQVAGALVSDSAKYPAEIQDQIEKKGEHKGYFSRIIADFKDKEQEVDLLFSSKDPTGSKMSLISDSKSSAISSSYLGKEVTVSGYQVDNLLWYASAENTTLLSGTAVTASVTGSRNMAILYVNFADNRERSLTDSQIGNYMNRVNTFMQKSSNYSFSLNYQIKRLDLDTNKTCALMPKVAYLVDGDLVYYTKYAAGQAGFDLSETSGFTDFMILIDPKNNTCDPAGMSMILPDSGWAYTVGLTHLVHEFGHNLGLAHSKGYECLETFIYNDCHPIPYGNVFDIMGNSDEYGADSFVMGDYGPYFKEYLGWLQGSQVANVTQSGTFTLEAYEQLPGSPGPTYPTKALKINTFSGGPSYYVSYRTANPRLNPQGPVIELASGDVGRHRMTYLLDTTPGSIVGNDDVTDGYLHDGQSVTDPYNGITFKGISHSDFSTTLEISFGPKAPGFGSLDVNWGRGTGYVAALGQKKDMSWPKMHYLVDVKCSGPYCTDSWNQWSGDCSAISPDGLCPPIDTTDTSTTLRVGSSALGYTYTYRVWIITLDDDDNTKIKAYPWKGETDASTNCGGPNNCNTTISWPKVTYKGIIFEKGTSTDPCLRMQTGIKVGCVRSFDLIQDDTTFMFRGLPTGINFSGFLYTTDFSETNHTIRIYNDLGKSENYVRSCSTNSDITCTVPILSFVGYEPILYSVRVNDENGYNISGTKSDQAYYDGSVIKDWSWNYRAVIYPNKYASQVPDANVDCMKAVAAGTDCQIQDLYNANNSGYSLRFTGVSPGTDYRFIVCAFTCDTSGGNTYVANRVFTSEAMGPQFFSTDPFADGPLDTDLDGCIDVKEQGWDWKQGGQRDPENKWDFWDVPVPAINSTNWKLPVGDPGRPKMDHAIGASDAQAVFAYFKAGAKAGAQGKNGISYDSHYGYQMGLTSDPNFTDGMFYDRTPNKDQTQFWKVGPPAGVISAGTAQLEFAIFKNGGSKCY